MIDRSWAFAFAFFLTIAILPKLADAQGAASSTVEVDADAVVRYIQSCRKANGAFGPMDQEYTDAAWNYPAVSALLILGEKIERPADILAYGVGHPQGHGGYGHWQFFHQHQLRNLLGKPIAPRLRQIPLEHQGYEVRYYGSPFGTGGDFHFKTHGRAEPSPIDVNAEKLGYYNLSSLYYTLAALKASGREPSDKQPLLEFLRQRQSPSGGFVDVRAKDALPLNDEAQLTATFHAIAALKLLGEAMPNAERCVAFINSCQVDSGAFQNSPRAELGNSPDIYYTWAAMNSLSLLGAKPSRRDAVRASINQLQNADGGFGDKPGWRSRLYSTYYAIHSLALLDGDARTGVKKKQVVRTAVDKIPDGKFKIYQGLFKMPVCTADDLAGLHKRGFNQLAFKSEKFDEAARLLPVIQERNLPMDVILCPEMYPHRLLREGQMQLNHVGNFTLDPRWNDSQRAIWQAADNAGRQNLPWMQYHQRTMEPLQQLGALCYPEQDFEMEYAYSSYDAGVETSRGYNAVLAGFNWAPRDFIRVFPWRERYVDKLTPVADADAHGDLAKWSPQLDHVRHLYIATGPTFAEFLEAARTKRVVCVIAEPEGVASGASYYGAPAAVDYVRDRVNEWRWWDKK